ncbi:signal recognition particle-docking protein FtsY [Marinitenerispora sediminis]|uniref:Signal recognition particle receptor FtsY n=1 Tax=Marinitenerispora sediminis TaxID=1931232 RepID=A0A368T377_9ACTN|nr:signal recognition particle-docking protein FtsY [Marinitenerispora sediminis]RCV49450.1 signal recognition particle-docking protein FtsY [Marinitenerispora sediminis]RCV50516.1 signal recognition particle-docking protein FtsY [Marinitenerispora sediminis]RCV56808.1 signal recognition particle-docking protein FtsY [Marinitenerispora sediminis]
MDYTIVAVAIFVLALLVVGGAFLIRPRRPQEPRPPRAGGPGQGDQGASGATAVAEREEAEAGPVAVAEPAAPVEPPPAAVPIETPPPSAGRLVRLRARLARSQNVFGRGLLDLLSSDRLDEDAWDEIEDTLITADVGVTSAAQIVQGLRTRVKVLGSRTPEEVRELLRQELIAQINPELDRTVLTGPHGERPGVVMVVGVNGTGKTTTTGKLARVLVGDGRSVVLGAADTFRAAAADQLETWGSRVGAPVVRKDEGADPASVAFDAVARGLADGVDTVIIDTAGRLHTKVGLMDELGKVKRVVEKQSQVDEVLLVLDATTGQNGLRQARVFAEAVNVTGIVLTKLDGTAKGGIIIQVQRELGVPVKLVGLGEGPDDLAPFDAEEFVDAVLRTD